MPPLEITAQRLAWSSPKSYQRTSTVHNQSEPQLSYQRRADGKISIVIDSNVSMGTVTGEVSRVFGQGL
jgi:hypothetical protein